MLSVTLQFFLVTAIVKCQGSKETEVVVLGFSTLKVGVKNIDATVFDNVMRKEFTAPDRMIAKLGNKESNVSHLIDHPLVVTKTWNDLKPPKTT